MGNSRKVSDNNLEEDVKFQNAKKNLVGKESWYLNLFNEVVLDFEYFDLKQTLFRESGLI